MWSTSRWDMLMHDDKRTRYRSEVNPRPSRTLRTNSRTASYGCILNVCVLFVYCQPSRNCLGKETINGNNFFVICELLRKFTVIILILFWRYFVRHGHCFCWDICWGTLWLGIHLNTSIIYNLVHVICKMYA